MRVYVGLSGGVDSGVSAALLQQAGHDVTGVFIKIWQPEFIECTWREDRLDAMRIAAHLHIPFREIDLSDAYKQKVIDTMIAGYQKGITPNPDVLCNEFIKFGIFYSWARAQGADSVATGHYARVQTSPFALLRGVDPNKDQSYFIHRIHGSELPYIQFPIGDKHKTEVRALAARFNLPVAHKPDSQGLCFVGEVSMRDFLKRYIDVPPGDVLDEHGVVIGRHEGALLYTIGQRHGFTSHSDVPQYVIDVDVRANTLTVGARREESARSSCELVDQFWINEPPHSGRTYHIQTRYREAPVHGRVEFADTGCVVMFEQPHLFAHGQSLVIYDDAQCLGGGTIG